MARKMSIDLNVIVPILVGIIVLLGVYIIVNQQKKVTFADPVVSQEVYYQPDYFVDSPMYRSEPIFLQQPTFFNPNHGDRGTTNNLYNIQTKEPFSLSEFILPSQEKQSSISQKSIMPTMNMPTMNMPSMNMPSMNKPTMNMPTMNMPPMNKPTMNMASQPVMNVAVPLPMDSSSDSSGII